MFGPEYSGVPYSVISPILFRPEPCFSLEPLWLVRLVTSQGEDEENPRLIDRTFRLATPYDMGHIPYRSQLYRDMEPLPVSDMERYGPYPTTHIH
jgi:hypothetical protein